MVIVLPTKKKQIQKTKTKQNTGWGWATKYTNVQKNKNKIVLSRFVEKDCSFEKKNNGDVDKVIYRDQLIPEGSHLSMHTRTVQYTVYLIASHLYWAIASTGTLVINNLEDFPYKIFTQTEIKKMKKWRNCKIRSFDNNQIDRNCLKNSSCIKAENLLWTRNATR